MEYLLFRVITSYWKNHKRGEPVLAELTDLPMESPQLTFHHSPSEAEGGRRCRQHPSLSAPFQQSKKKKGCCFTAMKTSSIITHRAPHPAESQS